VYSELLPFNKGTKAAPPLVGPASQHVEDELKMVAPDGHLRLSPETASPMVVILVGCPWDFPNFLTSLDIFLAQGSEVHILSERPLEERVDLCCKHLEHLQGTEEGWHGTVADCDRFFHRISVIHHVGSTTFKSSLTRLPLAMAHCVIILAERRFENEDSIAVDSRSLTSAIALRGVQHQQPLVAPQCGSKTTKKKRFKLVTELLDPKTQQVVDHNDGLRKLGSFTYSAALETGMFVMGSANKSVYNVVMQLLSPEPGVTPQITATPVKHFLRFPQEMLSFFDLQTRIIQRCGGVLLGWRLSSDRYAALNPAKKTEGRLWSADGKDLLLVLRPAE